MTFKKLIPYIVTSLLVIGFWLFATMTENYIWFKKEQPARDIIEQSLRHIFWTKVMFWLTITNLAVATLTQTITKRLKFRGLLAGFSIIIYVVMKPLTDKMVARDYFEIFKNQSVAEEYIDDPIIEAGQNIGPYIIDHIKNKNAEYRRYAIGGLQQLKYISATDILKSILFDTTEIVVFRADAFEALVHFDTDDTKQIIKDFEISVTTDQEKEVLHLGKYFVNNK